MLIPPLQQRKLMAARPFRDANSVLARIEFPAWRERQRVEGFRSLFISLFYALAFGDPFNLWVRDASIFRYFAEQVLTVDQLQSATK